MPWIKTLSVLLALLVGQTSNETYEQSLNQGLKSEGLRQWPEAVSYYVKAIQLQPANPLPRDRLISIFKELKSQGQSTTDLELLLPEGIRTQLGKIGAIETASDQAESLRTMNIIFWTAAGLIVAAIVGGFIWLMIRRNRDEDEDSPKFSTRSAQKRKPSGEGGVSKNTVETKRDFKVTEKTRQEMTDVIAGVKSITTPHKTMPELATREEVAALKESDVLAALADTMISEVVVEDTDVGRFSKMTIEAQLIFDDEKKS